MEYLKEQQAGSMKLKNPGKIQAMTPKRRNLEAEKKEAYKRIDASRPPICEGCETSSCISHSHRFPQAYQNYKFIAVDESIDLYCMEMANNCHSLYERGFVYRLKNGEEVMNYLMRTDYQFFMGTGTTAVACVIEKMKYVGSEISNRYVEMSKKRIATFENQTSLF